jgi:sn-glycerol 3-phosphate transport system permease protein
MHKKRDPIWIHVVLIIAVLTIASPILFAIIKATQARGDVLSPSLIPGTEFFSNLKIVWTDQNLGRYIQNSLWIALSVTV